MVVDTSRTKNYFEFESIRVDRKVVLVIGHKEGRVNESITSPRYHKD